MREANRRLAARRSASIAPDFGPAKASVAIPSSRHTSYGVRVTPWLRPSRTDHRAGCACGAPTRAKASAESRSHVAPLHESALTLFAQRPQQLQSCKDSGGARSWVPENRCVPSPVASLAMPALCPALSLGKGRREARRLRRSRVQARAPFPYSRWPRYQTSSARASRSASSGVSP